MKELFNSFWVAFGVNAVLAYPIYLLLLRMKSRQTIDPYAPEAHKEKQGTPTMGGLMVLGGLIVSLAVFMPTLTPALLLVAFALIGFVDDFVVPKLIKGKRGLGWKQKLLMEIVLAGGCLYASSEFAKDPVWLGVGMFMVLFFSNAYNLADGLDALAGSLLIALGIGFFVAANFVPGGGVLALSLIGAILPFLFFNSPPAKVFMGDVGSLAIGSVIGFMNASILMRAQQESILWPVFGALFVLNFVLIVELVLVPIQVGYYKRTKKRIFPATPIHHGFEVKGIPERKVVWWFLLTQLVCVAISWTMFANLPREAEIPAGSGIEAR